MGRFLHTMLRVGDLQRSVDFYCAAFGMNEIKRRDVPDGKYTLAFVGFGDEEHNTVIELTYNYGVEKYELGGAFGHLAVGVPDVAALWVVGLGAVATTLIAGVEAVKLGIGEPIGSLTQMGTIRLGKRTENRVPKIKDFVPLASLDEDLAEGLAGAGDLIIQVRELLATGGDRNNVVRIVGQLDFATAVKIRRVLIKSESSSVAGRFQLDRTGIVDVVPN